MEDNIQIKRQNALKAYEEGCSDVKRVLNNLLGPETFRPKSSIDQINDFADICRLNGTTEERFFKACHDAGLEPDEIAYRQMKMITKGYNQNWVPDYNNSTEQKWTLYFWLNNPGFQLDAADYDGATSAVGARLVFKSREMALDAAKKFLPIYEAYYTLNSAAKATMQSVPMPPSNDPFERDCKSLGYDHKAIIPDLTPIPIKYQAAVRSFIRLLVGADAKREGYVFDYQDNDEEKWYPWWDMEVDGNNPSGFRLHGAYCDDADSGVGARLSLRNEKEVREMVEDYKDDYRNVMKQ